MRTLRIFVLAMVLLIAGLSAIGCGSSGISEVEYQAVQAQLQTAQKSAADALAQVTQLQQDLAAAQAETADLQTQLDAALDEAASGAQSGDTAYAALKQQYDAALAQVDLLNSQIDGVQDDFAAAQAQIDAYAAQVADLQQQVADLAPTPTPEPIPLTVENVKTAVWDRIALERVQGFVPQLQFGRNLQAWADQHVIQMQAAHKITIYTDAVVGTQAAMQAIGYDSVEELVNATFMYWQISQPWFEDQILSPGATYGAVAVAQSGNIFYISFMSSNYA